jgi:hypothetical protein
VKRHQWCSNNSSVTRRGGDKTSSIEGGNEEEATTHLFLFHLALEGDKLRHEERRRTGERWWRLGGLEVEEDLVGPVGPNCLATRADSREKWRGPREGMG